MKEWTTPDSRNPPSTANLEEGEIVDALGNDGNASMPEQVNRPYPWSKRKMMMMIMMMMMKTVKLQIFRSIIYHLQGENTLMKYV